MITPSQVGRAINYFLDCFYCNSCDSNNVKQLLIYLIFFSIILIAIWATVYSLLFVNIYSVVVWFTIGVIGIILFYIIVIIYIIIFSLRSLAGLSDGICKIVLYAYFTSDFSQFISNFLLYFSSLVGLFLVSTSSDSIDIFIMILYIIFISIRLIYDFLYFK